MFEVKGRIGKIPECFGRRPRGGSRRSKAVDGDARELGAGAAAVIRT